MDTSAKDDDFTERVEKAFTILDDYDFSARKQAAIFGRKLPRISQLRAMKTHLSRTPDEETAKRADAIITLADELGKLFTKKKPLRQWLKFPQGQLDDKSPEEMLLSGKVDNIKSVVDFAKHIRD